MTSPSDSPHQSEGSDNSVQTMDKLFQSFEIIAALAEEEIRQQKISETYSIFGLSEASYREQFESYLSSKDDQTKNKSDMTSQEKSVTNITPVKSLLRPVSFLDTKVSDFVDLLKEVSLVKLSAVSEKFYCIPITSMTNPALPLLRYWIRDVRETLAWFLLMLI